jgi:CelD/BcsL family acetyltransferase involved in cellulose biosynthesis
VGPSEIRTRPEDTEDLVDGWRRLAAGGSYFLSPDWVLGWWETLGAGTEGEVAVWRGPSGELEALAPLGRSRQRLHRRLPVPVTAWTNLGSGPGAADHCGWPVAPGRAGDVAAWIAAKGARAPLLLSDLDPETGAPLVPAGARRVATSACPRLDIPAEGGPSPWSANFRRQLRSYARKLADREVTFRWVACKEMTDELLETVLVLHERRQRVTGWVSSFDRSRVGLHRRLIARAGQGRGPAMVLAERDGRAVGALYGFCWAEVFAYYQTGWEPEWADANLGIMLVAEAIRLAGLDGARVFDLLRGAEAYKYRFGASDRVDSTWLVPSGLGGRVLDLRYRLAQRRRATAARSGPSAAQPAATRPTGGAPRARS